MFSKKSLHPRARLSSIGYALQGLRQLIRQEPNAKLHLLASVLVVVAGLLRHLSRGGWQSIVFAIALVWIAEAFNTAIELLCDLWCDGAYHPKIEAIKDLSAAGVLLAAIASIVIAALAFF